ARLSASSPQTIPPNWHGRSLRTSRVNMTSTLENPIPQLEPRLIDAADGLLRWWVLHTRARNEKLVARWLDNEGIPTYVPVVVVRHTYAKRKVAFEVPLFPGYVFMHGTLHERLRALQTNRVVRVIDVDDQARLQRELTQIRRAIESGASLE